MSKEVSAGYGEAAQSIAPVTLMMAGFLLVYTVWFGFAWGSIGWMLFVGSVMVSIYLGLRSIQNIRHAKGFENRQTEEGKKIGKAMALLSTISYGLLWIAVILLFILDLAVFIMPIVTLIIGLHFIPQAKIMNRKIDYVVAPFPILTASVAIYFAFQSTLSLFEVYALAGVGGAIATLTYGFYTLSVYKMLARESGVEI